MVGSPDEVVDRLSGAPEVLGAETNLLYIDMGGQPASEYREIVELVDRISP